MFVEPVILQSVCGLDMDIVASCWALPWRVSARVGPETVGLQALCMKQRIGRPFRLRMLCATIEHHAALVTLPSSKLAMTAGLTVHHLLLELFFVIRQTQPPPPPVACRGIAGRALDAGACSDVLQLHLQIQHTFRHKQALDRDLTTIQAAHDVTGGHAKQASQIGDNVLTSESGKDFAG
jgi:hypothetical protein